MTECSKKQGVLYMTVRKGKVKWFNNPKGFGFIVVPDRDDEIMAHFSEIQMDGFRHLAANQEVEFELIEHEKGLRAKNIVPL